MNNFTFEETNLLCIYNTGSRTGLIVRGWDANPWVWVIAFERIDKATAQREEACHA